MPAGCGSAGERGSTVVVNCTTRMEGGCVSSEPGKHGFSSHRHRHHLRQCAEVETSVARFLILLLSLSHDYERLCKFECDPRKLRDSTIDNRQVLTG